MKLLKALVSAFLLSPIVAAAQTSYGGFIDSSFGINGKVSQSRGSLAMHVDAGDHIFQGPRSEAVFPSGKTVIYRFTKDGAIDPAFGQNGVDTLIVPGREAVTVLSIATQADGKVIVGMGGATPASTYPAYIVARRLAGGGADTSFHHTGYAFVDSSARMHSLRRVSVAPNGTIVGAGLLSGSGGSLRVNVFCLKPDGQPNAAFGNNGVAYITPNPGNNYMESVNDLAIQPDGKVFIGGWKIDNQDPASALFTRLSIDGTLDNNLINGAAGICNSIVYLNALADGKVLVGGWTQDETPRLFQCLSNGSLNAGFGVNGVVSATLPKQYMAGNGAAFQLITVQPNGAIVFTGKSIPTSVATMRFHANGTLDTHFGGDGQASYTVGAFEGPYGVYPQSDGKIVLGINLGDQNGITGNIMLRYKDSLVTSAAAVLMAEQKVSMMLYPNPASGKITVQSPVADHTETLEIFDSKGKMLREQEILFDHAGKAELDTQALPTGPYLYRFTDKNKRITTQEKLLILH